MNLKQEHFVKTSFSVAEVKALFQNAERDLMIAKTDKIAEVKFTFAYQALLKSAITLLAKNKYRLRSSPGHHIKALEALAGFLKDQAVLTLGNAMRTKRNIDMYGIKAVITDKEAADYVKFVERVVGACERML